MNKNSLKRMCARVLPSRTRGGGQLLGLLGRCGLQMAWRKAPAGGLERGSGCAACPPAHGTEGYFGLLTLSFFRPWAAGSRAVHQSTRPRGAALCKPGG